MNSRDRSKRSRKLSQQQEKSLAKKLNGKVTPASGALWGVKGDVRTNVFLAECKTTEKDSYRLHFKNVWEKIRNEALRDGMRIPLLEIEIQKHRFIIYNNKEGRLQVDRQFSYLVKTISVGRSASSRLNLADLAPSFHDAETQGKILVIRLERSEEVLALMRTEDFETCISTK